MSLFFGRDQMRLRRSGQAAAPRPNATWRKGIVGTAGTACSFERQQRSPRPDLAAPADLLDDHAVVELALAVAQAGLQHIGMNIEERQRLPDLLGLIEHEMDVLEGLARPALGAEIARDHLAALGVHDLRVGGRALRDLEEGGRIEAEAGREHQAFGERQAVEAEDEIDGELGAAAVADAADM